MFSSIMDDRACFSSYTEATNFVNTTCNYTTGEALCTRTQFCDKFHKYIPWLYFGISCVSALFCLLVFLSYYLFPRLRHSGHSTKVLMIRTLVDLVLALSHIVAVPAGLTKAPCQEDPHFTGCRVLGTINQVALFASNLWFIVIALDLLKAIRNPFSAQPTYSLPAHFIIWPISVLSGVVLALLIIKNTPGGPGPSMFFWCWVSIKADENFTTGFSINNFAIASLAFYYFWLMLFLVISVVIILVAVYILRQRLATSSETRRLVLRQNLVYVLILAIEGILSILLWIIQLSLVGSNYNKDYDEKAYFLTNVDFALAVLFAIFHSLRGTVDFIAWCIALSLGKEDLKDLFRRLKNRNRKDLCTINTKTLRTPLITTKSGDSIINKALRRNAMYCINVGILDAVALHQQSLSRIQRVGSVRDRFVAAKMIDHDQENQDLERDELYRENPEHREQSIRRLQFPATATIHSFSFIDLEPSLFSSLRTIFGTTPKKYRASFKISNAADIDKEGMLEKFTEGKSGSFFYFTRDYRYIIKTVNSAEEKFLQKIAYRYYHHMKHNPSSVIARFYGLHKVRLAREQRYITVVVMDNIFHNKEQLKMHERYDLKGSRVGRRAIKGNQERNAYKGTLKDLDLGDRKIWIGQENKEQLIEQLREDAAFLQSCDIMDYSLLLGIHYHSKPGKEAAAQPTEQPIPGGLGEDFVDVSIKHPQQRRRHPHSAYSSGYGTDITEPEISPIREHTVFSETNETNLSETTRLKQIGTPWFREDYGGLRSCSPHHPRLLEENAIPSVVEGDSSEVPVATYYFGIIDILQEYTLRKKAEHLWKTRFLCQDKHWLSAVNAKEYSQRFVDFMEQVFQ